jgi:predicted extracellular nuclease
MAGTFRVASFNVENLFSRAKILNLRSHAAIDDKLAEVGELNKLIQKTSNFTAAEKQRIVDLYDGLKDYITIRENRGKLFNSSKTKVAVNSGSEWDGEIEFKRDKFSELARENTAKVIKSVKADVACIVEAEDRPTLKAFDSDLLNYRFKYEMLLDGNDPRGIDVGVYSRFPLGGIRTHMFDKSGNSTIFSRDCPEYEILLPNGKSLFLLCNHLKSKGYDYNGTASARRKLQATRIAEILEGFDLSKDWVIVAGDMNDTPDSDPLKPLMSVANLFDVLDLQFGSDKSKRWTYEYKKVFDQIDYVLVSKPLKGAFKKAGVERRGIYQLEKNTEATNGKIPVETEFDTVNHWTNAASDHGAVWADFNL